MSMDGSTKRRLLLGFLTNWIGKLSATIVQLIQIPVFLHFWSVPLYGEWMIVTSIPSYLSFSSIGFGNVAGNEMTMMVAREDYEGALRVFQSCWWLITIICSACMLLFSVALYFLPVARVPQTPSHGRSDTKWIIFYLGFSVLLGQLETLLQSAYRCVGRYPYGSFLKSVFSLAAFGGIMLPVASAAEHASPHWSSRSPTPWTLFPLHHGPPRHPVDPLRLEPRQIRRDSQAHPSGHRLHGLPHRQRPQPAGNPARRRLRPRPHGCRRLRNRPHRLAGRPPDGPDGQQHLRAGDVDRLRSRQLSRSPARSSAAPARSHFSWPSSSSPP